MLLVNCVYNTQKRIKSILNYRDVKFILNYEDGDFDSHIF